jgi:hypothetical protein
MKSHEVQEQDLCRRCRSSHFGKVPGKSKEVILEAQKVSGHMREGHRKPREVPGNKTCPNQTH